MAYTVIISDSTEYETGVSRRVVVEGDDLNDAYGIAQAVVATEIFEARHGKGAEMLDHADEWTRIYDHIPVLVIIEGTPKVWLNDSVVEPTPDNYDGATNEGRTS